LLAQPRRFFSSFTNSKEIILEITNYTVFTTLTDNGSTETVTLTGSVNDVCVMFGTGVTFDSGTLTGEVSYDGGTTWMDCVNAIAITSATAGTHQGTYRVYGECLFRLTLAGSTSPSLDVAVQVARAERVIPHVYTLTADGSTPTFMADGAGLHVSAGLFGDFGSGSVYFEFSPDGGTTWYKESGAITANTSGLHEISNHALFRFTLSGATDPSLTIVAFPHEV
jgi:hypothetical protein